MTDKATKAGKSYLQFLVPLNRRARWYRALKAALGGVRGMRWQDGYFHVTVAFIDDEVDVAGARKLAEVMDEELAGMATSVLPFDTVKAFTTQGGGMHVVYLTASRGFGEFAGLIDRLRSKISSLGYDLGPFRLHIMLARVSAKSIALGTLRDRIGKIGVPIISLTLTTADYRYFREFGRVIREWKLPVG